MNKVIQKKIEEYKKIAGNRPSHIVHANSTNSRNDILSNVIHSKKEGDAFMAEVESAFQRAK